jgi:coenzyme F420-reducing hydrogenase gamma subunit
MKMARLTLIRKRQDRCPLNVDNGRDLTLPKFRNVVRSLDQVVDVDYYIPGCPPTPVKLKMQSAHYLKESYLQKGLSLRLILPYVMNAQEKKVSQRI